MVARNPSREAGPGLILVAEDDVEERLLTQYAFEECRIEADVRFVYDGEELVEYLRRRGRYANGPDCPSPDLILLDLKMPRKDGSEVLREIKSDPELRRIPVVVLTTSAAPEDVRRCYDLGANSYITKPITYGGMLETVRALGTYWLGTVELPDKRPAVPRSSTAPAPSRALGDVQPAGSAEGQEGPAASDRVRVTSAR
jgi:CheY-like chemotaxis protein